MRSSNIILFCLLATVSCYLSHNTSSTSPSEFLPGRRSLRSLTMPSSNHQVQDQHIEVSAEIERSLIIEEPMVIEHRSKEDADELLYHIDYHGVTTHPAPIPKHP